MTVSAGAIRDLTRSDYEAIRKLVYEKSGISLGEHKMQLVRARLGKRVREGGFDSFTAYFEHVLKDSSGQAMSELLDSISTNTTHLFREVKHFHLLAELLGKWLPDWRKDRGSRPVRIWSAACSSGEEPYSIAMVVHDALRNQPGVEAKILATDISTRMLAKAERGVFEEDRIATVPPAYQKRYLRKAATDNGPLFEVAQEARRLITFSHFNLMSPTFPFKNAFDIVFCRNVMIYFDKPTQETLVNKFATHMVSGGHLLIGHSESLNNLQHPFAYVEPTVYRKQ